MASIKAVVFDYGNVLSQPQQHSDFEAMAAVLKVATPTIEQLYWHFREAYDLQQLDGLAYWGKVAEAAEVALNQDQVDELIDLDNKSWARPSGRIVKWAKKLKDSSIRTAVLSNMPADLRLYLRSCDWMPEFDHMAFSCELGIAKPDAKIYRHLMKSIDLPAEQILFIDDRQPNVDAAMKVGMHSIQYSNPEEAAAEISLNHELPDLD